MPVQSRSSTLPPIMLALSAVVLAVNWSLRPDRAGAWPAALVLLVVMAVSWWSTRRHAASVNITAGVVIGCLMLDVKMLGSITALAGAPLDSALAQRLTMALLGVVYIAMGNAMPKTLTPLAAMRRDPVREQADRRFAGWAWVIVGTTFSAIWLVAPLDWATPISVTELLGGTVAIGLRTVGRGVSAGPRPS